MSSSEHKAPLSETSWNSSLRSDDSLMKDRIKAAYVTPKASPKLVIYEALISFLKPFILCLIVVLATISRLFSVVRFESIIHEFDPWFNYRATKVLVEKGIYEFWDWFDERSWYPLGRVAGGTLYPGLMLTSGFFYKIFEAIGFPVDIRNVCVMLAPAFSGVTALVTYFFAKELAINPLNADSVGLLAAAFMAIAPGYISRSVAGSYDNEAIAITLLVLTFFLWIRASKTGSMFWSALAGLFYFYMVSAWGGYVYITNMIPLHIFTLIVMRRFNFKHYVSYSVFYVIGTIGSMQIPFVGFNPVRNNDHMAALGMFGFVQVVAFSQYLWSQTHSRKDAATLLIAMLAVVFMVALLGLIALTNLGYIAPWTGRFYSLWDHDYAKIHIPIIASVSEHQPPAWPSFFMDGSILVWLFPAGIFLCFKELRDEHVFMILFAVTASYFAGVMVRLILTLIPCVCLCSSLIMSEVLNSLVQPSSQEAQQGEASANDKVAKAPGKKFMFMASLNDKTLGMISSAPLRYIALAFQVLLLTIYSLHCTWATETAYSSPSVVMKSSFPDGTSWIIDDYREAYGWLRENTPEDTKVMSWWDYGYQIAGFADRITLVDNNTWNNTHIATVGKAMASPEKTSYPILRQHDVDYVLIMFGGLLGVSSDDLNKFLWMVRIAQGIWPQEVKESSFFTSNGEYRIDDMAADEMKNSLMYKMSYYGIRNTFRHPQIMDRVRHQPIPTDPIDLYTLEEAYTSENWLCRIYRVKKPDTFARDHERAMNFHRAKAPKPKKLKSVLVNKPSWSVGVWKY